MKRLAPILGACLLLTACGDNTESESTAANVPIETVKPATDWIDEDQKLRVFVEHTCWDATQESSLDPYTHATAAAIGVLADTNSTPDDKLKALSITTRPADAYEQDLEWAKYDDSPVPEHSVPRTLTPNNPNVCEGWVWEKHLEQAYDKKYADFTFEKARELGAI